MENHILQELIYMRQLAKFQIAGLDQMIADLKRRRGGLLVSPKNGEPRSEQGNWKGEA